MLGPCICCAVFAVKVCRPICKKSHVCVRRRPMWTKYDVVVDVKKEIKKMSNLLFYFSYHRVRHAVNRCHVVRCVCCTWAQRLTCHRSAAAQTVITFKSCNLVVVVLRLLWQFHRQIQVVATVCGNRNRFPSGFHGVKRVDTVAIRIIWPIGFGNIQNVPLQRVRANVLPSIWAFLNFKKMLLFIEENT